MEKNKIYEKIRAQLASKSNKDISEALDTIIDHALQEFLPDIAGVYSLNNDADIRKKITSIFNDLKYNKAVPVFVSVIMNEKNKETLLMLVSAAWQCGLNFSDHSGVFVPMLLSEDFTLVFEAYTVLENNIDFMDKIKTDELRTSLVKIQNKIPEKIAPLYNGLMDRLDSVS
jgi:hypothetical protein